ncbi:peroxiredoxin [Parerythrobacter jejuensis]|uniref:thioredoxin-dependent peroxiredoxin n=1 Tax=Parerythrobacter jejuensis TaxID=795812 RepID=A0A845B4E5_9SPHN|nr:peroxiredoxin [Parerythrobacter jejuensis]MXP31078.1 redoxin domain-containing protein [Parerythrobacter jejuensis]MXP33838.1 redoxin domain-containing protein [Parerythrobacter jejuensis]
MSTRPHEGDQMPDVAMETPDGGTVKPSNFADKKLVVFFYPKDNTPGCTTEATEFSAAKAEFEKAGCAILGVSKDSPKKHQNFIAKHGLTVDLATDEQDGGLSDALGIWTEKKMYGKTYMGMVRTTYLVGPDGMIARVWDKVKVKGHVAEVLEAAQAL